jgi:adenylylsulfate kinase
MRIVIIGLPGSGKTTLARKLAEGIRAVHLNADDIRTHVHKDLGFSKEDRLHQARSMAFLINTIHSPDRDVVCDFVCPIPETRAIISEACDFLIFMNTIDKGRFEDTNRIFVDPEDADLVIMDWEDATVQTVVAACLHRYSV